MVWGLKVWPTYLLELEVLIIGTWNHNETLLIIIAFYKLIIIYNWGTWLEQRLISANFQHNLIDVFMAIIKAKFTLLEVQIKRFFAYPTKFCQPCFSIAPEAFNSIYMGLFVGKFILTVPNTKVFFVPKVDQPRVSTPAIWMNNAFQLNPSANDVLQRFTTNIRNNFSINFSIPLENSKYNCFVTSTAPSFTFYAPGAEVTLIDFDITRKRWFIITMFFNPCSNTIQIPIDCVSIETSNLGYLNSVLIKE